MAIDFIELLYKTFPTYRLGDLVTIAGRCAIESREDTIQAANELAELKNTGYNIHAMRGGTFKPRTSARSFQGLGEDGLKYLCEAREQTGLPIVTEIMDTRDIELFRRYRIDVLQIGSRNMQNYSLLRTIGESRGTTPVLLKRGMCSNMKEIEGAIGYLGNSGLIFFTLRGLQKIDYGNPDIRELMNKMMHQNPNYRFFNDVDEIVTVKNLVSDKEHIIVGFDPSHIAGNWQYVPQVAKEAVEHGADFLIIETVSEKQGGRKRKCDGEQGVVPTQLAQILDECNKIYRNRIQN